MESMFKKRDRMLAYAYALEQFLARDPEDFNGACYDLIDFLEKEAGYDLNNFFFFNGRCHFPELYKEKTRELEHIHDHWFNNNQERIQALKNILKIK